MSSSTVYCIAEIPEGKTFEDVILSFGYEPNEDETFEMLGGVADYVVAPEEYSGQTEEYFEDLEEHVPEGVFRRDDEGNCELVFTREIVTKMLQKHLSSIKSASEKLTLADLTDPGAFYMFTSIMNYKYGYWFEMYDEDGVYDIQTEKEFLRFCGSRFNRDPLCNEIRFGLITAMRYHM